MPADELTFDELLVQEGLRRPGGKIVNSKIEGPDANGWREVTMFYEDGTSCVSLFGPESWKAIEEIARTNARSTLR